MAEDRKQTYGERVAGDLKHDLERVKDWAQYDHVQFAAKTAGGSGVAGAMAASVVQEVAGAAAGIPVGIGVAAAGVVLTPWIVRNRDAWRDVDRQLADGSQPTRLHVAEQSVPSIYNYKHISTTLTEVSRDMRDENLNGKVQRSKEGIIDLGQQRNLDMTDPKNIAEYERALDMQIKRQTEATKASSSILPDWARFDESVSTLKIAAMKLADATAAKAELAQYKTELNAFALGKEHCAVPNIGAQRQRQPLNRVLKTSGVEQDSVHENKQVPEQTAVGVKEQQSKSQFSPRRHFTPSQ